MTLSLELPPSLEQELAREAEREGITISEQATFLIYLANAILQQDGSTHFRDAVRSVLEGHRIDAQRFSLAFEQSTQSRSRDWLVPVSSVASVPDHGQFGLAPERATSSDSKPERPSILGKYAYLGGGTEEFMREKQEELDREDRR